MTRIIPKMTANPAQTSARLPIALAIWSKTTRMKSKIQSLSWLDGIVLPEAIRFKVKVNVTGRTGGTACTLGAVRRAIGGEANRFQLTMKGSGLRQHR